MFKSYIYHCMQGKYHTEAFFRRKIFRKQYLKPVFGGRKRTDDYMLYDKMRKSELMGYKTAYTGDSFTS